MSEGLAAVSPQPKLSDQVAELERQLMMHKEMVRDKQQQIDTLRGELDHVKHIANEASNRTGKPTAREAVAWLIEYWDHHHKIVSDLSSERFAKLDRIPLFIRRIWGAV